jgi:hypothetical protein
VAAVVDVVLASGTHADAASLVSCILASPGFTPEEQRLVVRTLAALLHFGNVDFKDDDSSADGCIVQPESLGALDRARALLGFGAEQFDRVLRFRKLVVGMEVTMRPLKASEVLKGVHRRRGGGADRALVCGWAQGTGDGTS